MIHLLQLGLLVWCAGAFLGEGVVFAGAGIVAGALLLGEREELFTRHKWGWITFLLFVVLSIVSSRFAPRPLQVGAPWNALHVGLFGLALLVHVEDRTWKQLQWLVLVFLSLGAIVTIVQHYMGNWPWLYDRISSVVPVGRVLEPAEGGGFKGGGFHFHRLKHAHTVVPMFFVALSFLEQKRLRAIVIAVLVLSLVGLRFTSTRAAFIALGVGLVAHAFGKRSREVMIGSVALLLLPIALVIVGKGPDDRFIAWKQASELFLAHPFVGVGTGGYPASAATHPEYPMIHLDAHSGAWQVLAENGLIGALLVAAMLYLWWRNVKPTPLVCALIASFAALSLVHNLRYHPVVIGAYAVAFVFARRR